jgi:cation diffusion facilitator family transporter
MADCGNQVILLIGVKRSARPATAHHPLGEGRAMYFWSLMVALLLFSLGGLFSAYEGVHRLLHPEPVKDPWIAVAVLVVSIILEAGSLWGALTLIRAQQGTRTFWQWFQTTRQSELLVVAGEDVAALGGLAFALIALLLAIATGNPLFDAMGSLVIGLLLIIVAMLLVREVKSMIIGESADPLVHDQIEQFIAARPEVAEIYNLISLQWGNHIVVTVKARMQEVGDVATLIKDINACEAALKQKFPTVQWMFFEPDDAE